MATLTSPLTLTATAPARARADGASLGLGYLASVGYDRVMVLVSAWLLGGLFVDGWAHINQPSLETFFTPWHGLFYSGFFAVLTWLGVGIGRGQLAGYRGVRAIPRGYDLAALGAAIFLVGGVGDMLWHIVFGIEIDVEALLSPTHLVLATGLALLLTAPARAAWLRAEMPDSTGQATGLVPAGWAAQWPMLLSITFVLSLLSFFSQYVHPLTSAWATAAWQPLGTKIFTSGGFDLDVTFLFQVPMLAGVMLQAALLVGTLLLAVRHARLPFGSVTLVLGLSTLLMVLMRQKYAAGASGAMLLGTLAGALLVDVLLARLQPGISKPLQQRVFGAVAPMLVYGSYFVALVVGNGMWWTVHLWAGAIGLAGTVGLLLAILATPSRFESKWSTP
jgi:hypothetical protein